MTRILPIFGRKLEKSTLNLLKKHIDITYEMINVFALFTYDVFEQPRKEGLHLKKIYDLEKKADGVEKRLVHKLYAGAFLPWTRGLLHELINMMDDITDNIKDSANFVSYLKKMKVHEEVKIFVMNMVKDSVYVVKKLKEVIENFLSNKDIKMLKEEIERVEHEIDIIKKMTFDDILLGGKYDEKASEILIRAINSISNISDLAENCCDNIELLNISK